MGSAEDDWAGALSELVATSRGRLSAALETSRGQRWAHHEQRVVPAASTIKVPILLAALAECGAGRLHLDQLVPLPERRVGGSGALSLLPSLVEPPLRELLTLMIVLSDNDATNAVIDLVGIEPVAALLAKVPTRHTGLRRRMMDFASAQQGLENQTSAADLVAMMVALRQGRLLPDRLTQQAVDIMRMQQFREGLPAYLPDSVAVASKTGELFGVRHDVALLERDGSWVAVAVVATELADRGVDRGTTALATFAAIGECAAALL